MKKIFLFAFISAGLALAAQNPTGHKELMSIEKSSPCFLGFEDGPGAFQGYSGNDFSNMQHNPNQGEDGALVFDANTYSGNHGPLYYTLSGGDMYNCNYGLVDISNNPRVELRIKASEPFQITVFIQEGNNASWNYSKFSETAAVIDLTTDWQIVNIPNISSLSINGSDIIDLTSIGGLAFELGRTDGENYDQIEGGTVSVDYILLGSAISCENKVTVNDTSVVNYQNHRNTPKTIALVDSNTFLSEIGCDSTIRNYEYYCEEATQKDTTFVVTSDINFFNYTYKSASDYLGENENGCDSMLYSYTSYVYCQAKQTEETILIKTVNSTIFDDQTNLFASFTYQTEEGCDSIHSIYKHYEHSPNSVDTVYQTDTIYEMGTDTVFTKNTACDTLTIDLSGVTSTPYLASEFNLKVYPNPASEILYLNYTKPTSYTDALSLTIFDNSGRAIIQQQLPNNTIKTVDLSTMAAGTYFITIYDNSFNKVAQAPFVVNK